MFPPLSLGAGSYLIHKSDVPDRLSIQPIRNKKCKETAHHLTSFNAQAACANPSYLLGHANDKLDGVNYSVQHLIDFYSLCTGNNIKGRGIH